ncbi:MAG: ATP-binding cassette domain-containing protein [Planctomycetota bacterium]|nr:ATP-binding cassette domain-containing protein [Planctomycetota bacterium]
MNMIEVEGLTKRFGDIVAVDRLSFQVGEGEIFGLLGPNGAGKTTTIRILLTLIRPNEGKVTVGGLDVLTRPGEVRQLAGYVPQEISVDGELTGYENVLMYSKLYGTPRRGRKEAIDEILGRLELTERAHDMAKTYSGGMMRRLEIAQAMVNRPKLLFLDEPSIGLDPSAKRIIWDHIRQLREEFGSVVFMNTHDMNEADALCDRIGIMNKGGLVTVGSPAQLKESVGGEVISLGSANADLAEKVKGLGYSVVAISAEGLVDLSVPDAERAVPRLLESLREKGVDVETVSMKQPTLDDVFLKYTGSRMESGVSWSDARRVRRTFRRLRG